MYYESISYLCCEQGLRNVCCFPNQFRNHRANVNDDKQTDKFPGKLSASHDDHFMILCCSRKKYVFLTNQRFESVVAGAAWVWTLNPSSGTQTTLNINTARASWRPGPRAQPRESAPRPRYQTPSVAPSPRIRSRKLIFLSQKNICSSVAKFSYLINFAVIPRQVSQNGRGIGIYVSSVAKIFYISDWAFC